MGSIMSKIRDDEKNYEHLCKKYGEKIEYDGVYSVSHRWLEAKNEGKTSLSYKEFKKVSKMENLKAAIQYQEEKIKSLKNQLKDLK